MDIDSKIKKYSIEISNLQSMYDGKDDINCSIIDKELAPIIRERKLLRDKKRRLESRK